MQNHLPFLNVNDVLNNTYNHKGYKNLQLFYKNDNNVEIVAWNKENHTTNIIKGHKNKRNTHIIVDKKVLDIESMLANTYHSFKLSSRQIKLLQAYNNDEYVLLFKCYKNVLSDFNYQLIEIDPRLYIAKYSDVVEYNSKIDVSNLTSVIVF